MLDIQRLCIMLVVVILFKKGILLAHNINCGDFFAADNNFSYIEPRSINTSQITKCVEKLGTINLTKADAAYVWRTIVNIFNGVSNIPEETLLVLRSVISGINAVDYTNLTFTDIDMIQNFGLDYNLTNEQLSAIADRVRKDFASKEPEDYTVYDLKALRHILCGFNGSEIERIHPSAYKEASEDIGKLKCKPDVMIAFATLAVHKKAYGPAEYWNDNIIKKVGEVTKYLPKIILDKFYMKIS